MADPTTPSPSADQVESFQKTVFVRSWELFVDQPVVYIIAAALVAVIGGVSLGILAGPLTVGYIDMVRRHGLGEQPAIGDVFNGFSKFVPALLTAIVAAVGVMIGMVLLVIPGLIFAVLCTFAFHVIAYTDGGVGEALGQSIQLVKSNVVNVLLLVIILAILSAIGGTIVVGLLLTVPITTIAVTVAFEELRASA